MDNLLFYTLLILLAYYFLVYLPKQNGAKPNHPSPPLTQNQSTQTDFTEPEPTEYEPGIETTLNCPKPTLSPTDQTALEQTLNQLIKGMHDLNKELDKN